MNWKLLSFGDYETLCEWGEYWRFPLPPKDFLPHSGILFNGILVYREEQELCAGFIYETNSAVCWMEYIISNPYVRDRDLRKECINYLIDCLSEMARNKGFKYIFTTVKNENLINKYIDNGFVEGTKGSTEMIKIL